MKISPLSPQISFLFKIHPEAIEFVFKTHFNSPFIVKVSQTTPYASSSFKKLKKQLRMVFLGGHNQRRNMIYEYIATIIIFALSYVPKMYPPHFPEFIEGDLTISHTCGETFKYLAS